jgi:hypothetical protein
MILLWDIISGLIVKTAINATVLLLIRRSWLSHHHDSPSFIENWAQVIIQNTINTVWQGSIGSLAGVFLRYKMASLPTTLGILPINILTG